MFKLVIFDWSGTLSDDFEACYETDMANIQRFGVERIDIEQYRKEVFLPYTDYLKTKGINQTAEEAYAWWGKNYPVDGQEINLFPETKSVLDFLRKRGVSIAILSAHLEDKLHVLLQENGISEHFCMVRGSVSDKKTEIKDMMQKLGILPTEAIFVGDMVHDIDTARHAGIKVAVVTYGYTPKEKLEEAKPDYIFDSLEEVVGLFE